MMDKPDMMKSEVMMKKELTPRQIALRAKIKERLANIDASKIDLEMVRMRISNYRAGLDSQDLTETKRGQIVDVLDAILDVITEMKSMSGNTMMEK